ncbi:unnamed protein product [Dovyalis caffra]|uniref:Uncharacterized protein n=1 Tax=Dovyalis caffra TaxID=77055 RepID=A0AAV1S9Z7_9ROSI|nr:unnamed protein product [Dovyalis caffra]
MEEDESKLCAKRFGIYGRMVVGHVNETYRSENTGESPPWITLSDKITPWEEGTRCQRHESKAQLKGDSATLRAAAINKGGGPFLLIGTLNLSAKGKSTHKLGRLEIMASFFIIDLHNLTKMAANDGCNNWMQDQD